MKINLKQVAKLEKQYRNNDNHVSLNTLQTMIDVILNTTESPGYTVAVNTLVDLGVLEGVEIKKMVQQLNS